MKISEEVIHVDKKRRKEMLKVFDNALKNWQKLSIRERNNEA